MVLKSVVFEIYETDNDNKQKEDSLTEKSFSRIIIFSCFPVSKELTMKATMVQKSPY